MKALVTILFCLVACLPAGCKKRGSSGGSTSYGEPNDDGGQRAPIGAADTAELLAKAWKAKDFQAAKALFSPELIDSYDEQKLRDCILGPPNHEHKSAEITVPRITGEGRAEFRMDLTINARGEMGDRVLKKTWRVMLVRYNKKWLVDKIPIPESQVPG